MSVPCELKVNNILNSLAVLWIVLSSGSMFLGQLNTGLSMMGLLIIGVMKLYVYGKDEHTCKKLVELVKNVIDRKKGNVEQQFGQHELILIEDVCKE